MGKGKAVSDQESSAGADGVAGSMVCTARQIHDQRVRNEGQWAVEAVVSFGEMVVGQYMIEWGPFCIAQSQHHLDVPVRTFSKPVSYILNEPQKYCRTPIRHTPFSFAPRSRVEALPIVVTLRVQYS